MHVTKCVFACIVLMCDVITYAVPTTRTDRPQTRMFVEVGKSADDLKNSDQSIKDVYCDVSTLLVYKMQMWLLTEYGYPSDPESVSAVSAYLGFPADTVQSIDVAFTELLYRQRRGLIAIDNLAAAYFYACDIGHMQQANGAHRDRVLNVLENFERIFDNLGVDGFAVVRGGERELVENLRRSLRSIGVPVESWFSTNIPLMKNRAFVDETATDAAVNKLKRRFIDEYREKHAESYEHETDVTKITRNHVQLLGKIVPDVFGFAYGHVELFVELRGRLELVHGNAEKYVKQYSDVLILGFVILINRYFEFKGQVEDPFENVHGTMFALLYFFDPKSAAELVQKGGIPPGVVSVQDYSTLSNEYMQNLMDDSLKKFLTYFGTEDVEQWKQNRTIKFQYQNLDENSLLTLMHNNIEEAFEFLKLLVRTCESSYNH